MLLKKSVFFGQWSLLTADALIFSDCFCLSREFPKMRGTLLGVTIIFLGLHWVPYLGKLNELPNLAVLKGASLSLLWIYVPWVGLAFDWHVIKHIQLTKFRKWQGGPLPTASKIQAAHSTVCQVLFFPKPLNPAWAGRQ